MEEVALDQGREATAVQDAPSEIDGAASLLYELTGALDEKSQPTEPPPPALEPEAVQEEVIVASPPRIEPPVMIWKPERKFRLRRR